MLQYYFSVHANFKKDIDVKKLEAEIGKKAFKTTFLKDSLGKPEHKSAKISYRSTIKNDVYVDQEFERFLNTASPLISKITKYLDDFEGKLWITIVFTNLGEKPSIALSTNAIAMLHNLKANFDIDFI